MYYVKRHQLLTITIQVGNQRANVQSPWLGFAYDFDDIIPRCREILTTGPLLFSKWSGWSDFVTADNIVRHFTR